MKAGISVKTSVVPVIYDPIYSCPFLNHIFPLTRIIRKKQQQPENYRKYSLLNNTKMILLNQILINKFFLDIKNDFFFPSLAWSGNQIF